MNTNDATYNIDIHEETWGFYVDIENEKNDKKINTRQVRYYNDYDYNEFDYYEYIYDEHKYDKSKTKPSNFHTTNILIKVSSTTLATMCLTYFILFML